MSQPRRFFALLVFALSLMAPLALRAQGGMGGFGGMGGGRGGARGGGRGPMGAMGRQPEAPPINSVDLILKHGHDLALTDSQVARLTVVKAHQDSLVAQVRARTDSLAPGGRGGLPGDDDPSSAGAPAPSGPTGDEGAMRERMAARRDAMKSYRDAFRHGRDDAFAVLEKKQRKQAEKFEKELKKEMEEEMPSRSGGGMRGGRQGGGAGYPMTAR